MSDALEFWGHAAARSRAGDQIDTTAIPDAAGWRYAHALAERLGFRQVGASPGVYVCQRTPASLLLRWINRDDYGLWLPLFRTCFGREMSQRQWDWKYRGSTRRGVGVMHDGRLVAFYGGMPRDLSAQRALWRGVQVGDVMVDPEFRGRLGRRGPFHMAASTFLEQMLSKGAAFDLGFGFPNERAMRVAQHLKLYRAVDEVVELSWPADPAKRSRFLVCRSVSAEEALRDGDRLWQDMKRALGSAIAGVRDRAFLSWRYADHPAHTHTWLQLKGRITGRVLGLAICRAESEGRWEVLDLVGNTRHFPALIQGARELLPEASGQELFMWLTRSQAQLLGGSAPTTKTLQVWVPTNQWVPANYEGRVDGHWWLTGGDTDFR
jgi:hypothetical protein